MRNFILAFLAFGGVTLTGCADKDEEKHDETVECPQDTSSTDTSTQDTSATDTGGDTSDTSLPVDTGTDTGTGDTSTPVDTGGGDTSAG